MVRKILQKLKLPLVCATLSMTISGSCNAATNPDNNITYYKNNYTNFPNPERGFSTSYLTTNQNSPLQVSQLKNDRSKNITIIRRIYHIPQFRYSSLSPSFLNFVERDGETARRSGVKLIVRFAYNWDKSGYDAPRDRILSHLEQLRPILAANQDAIAYMEAGFIGAWGEWHTSSNNLDNTQDRKIILNRILSVLPDTRMVALRYPHHKTDAFNNEQPLTHVEAFSSSAKARTGAHNDCFVSASDDMGTYHWQNPESTKRFLSQDNRFVIQGGETCAPSRYDDCPNVLKELNRMRWSQLNIDYEPKVLKKWEYQGCMPEIKRRLGYRFRLLETAIPENVKPTGTFSMKFKVTNDGWASLYNPRRLEVVLRHSQTGKKYYLPVKEDPRMWLAGEQKVVNVVGGIPANIPAGKYQVLLNLPDPATKLYNRPEYAIRFANQNVWETSTGFNSLLQSVNISPNTPGSKYAGDSFFKPR